MLRAALACGDDDGPAEEDGGPVADLGTGGTDFGTADTDGSVPGTDGGPLADASTPGDDAGTPSDGGRDPFADAGELPVCGTPPTFAIDVVDPGACPAFTACGGDEVGIWEGQHHDQPRAPRRLDCPSRFETLRFPPDLWKSLLEDAYTR